MLYIQAVIAGIQKALWQAHSPFLDSNGELKLRRKPKQYQSQVCNFVTGIIFLKCHLKAMCKFSHMTSHKQGYIYQSIQPIQIKKKFVVHTDII